MRGYESAEQEHKAIQTARNRLRDISETEARRELDHAGGGTKIVTVLTMSHRMAEYLCEACPPGDHRDMALAALTMMIDHMYQAHESAENAVLLAKERRDFAVFERELNGN